MLCIGCAAPYPPVPTHELANRILDQTPAHVELPSHGPSPEELPPPKPNLQSSRIRHTSEVVNAVAHEPETAESSTDDTKAARSDGRRLKITQASALAEPLDRPPPMMRVEDAPPKDIHSESVSADQITLASAIDLAYRNSPQIQAARAKVDIAHAGKDIAYADFLPQLEVGYRHLAGDAPDGGYVLPTIATSVGSMAFGGSAQEFDVAELRAQWTVWDFGRTASKYGQAVVMQDIAALQYTRTQQTVAFDVASAYFDALSANASHQVADEAVRRAQSALNDSKNYLNRGAAIRNDLLRADLFLKEMQLDLVKTETARGIAIARLNRAIGINPSCSTEVVELSETPPFDESLTKCLQLAVENRREFGVVERGIAKAKLSRTEADSDFLPKINVGGVGSVQQTHGPDRYATLGTAGIGIELGLYQGGRRVGELNSAQGEICLAIASGKQVCDQIAYEVKVAFLTLTDATERIKVARVAATQASENLRVVKSLIEHGDTIFTDVIDAELTLTRAQRGYLIATYDYQTALARLAFAVGLPPESFLATPAKR
jgi:outer membrane protein